MPSLEEKPLTIDTTTSPTSTSASQQSPLFSPALSGVRHLLVGLDESEHSIEALKFAFTGYAKEGDRISVVRVLAPISGLYGTKLTPSDFRTEKLIKLYDKVGEIRKEIQATGVHYRVDIRWGDPKEAILEAANQIKPTCIIVGSRNRSGMASLVLGSVSSDLLKNADFPVLVVKKGSTTSGRKQRRMSTYF